MALVLPEPAGPTARTSWWVPAMADASWRWGMVSSSPMSRRVVVAGLVHAPLGRQDQLFFLVEDLGEREAAVGRGLRDGAAVAPYRHRVGDGWGQLDHSLGDDPIGEIVEHLR